MSGYVRDENGNPIPGAKVEVWHCNLRGMYSHFDSSQPEFNLRRAIITDAEGKYEFKSLTVADYIGKVISERYMDNDFTVSIQTGVTSGKSFLMKALE